LIGWNWLERSNLIHAVQGANDYIQVLNQVTNVPSFARFPERIVAFLGMGRFFGQDQALFQDRIEIGHTEIRVGLEEHVSGIEGPVVVIDHLMMQFTLVIESPYVVSGGQAVA
jgi:hypothetical protein